MTAQIHERLILDGEETSMAFCPPLPEDEELVIPDPDFPANLDERSGVLNSTACWRGYQGTWEIRNGKFHLVDLRGCMKLKQPGPLLAEWFSGVLRIPRGKLLQYVQMDCGSIHEQELHIRIEAGRVLRTRTVNNTGRMFDEDEVGWKCLPGAENRFWGEDDI